MIALLVMALMQAATVPAAPSTAALALARTISDAPQSAATVHRAEEQIAQHLLTVFPAWRGPGCDPQVPACRAAAERIAREAAPARLAAQRASRDQWLAIVIDGTMAPDEISAAARLAATPAGRSFARALILAGQPMDLPVEVRGRLAQAMMTPVAATDEKTLLDRFHDATASLPRRPLPTVPPPPQPSPPTRKP